MKIDTEAASPCATARTPVASVAATDNENNKEAAADHCNELNNDRGEPVADTAISAHIEPKVRPCDGNRTMVMDNAIDDGYNHVGPIAAPAEHRKEDKGDEEVEVPSQSSTRAPTNIFAT